MTGVAPSTSPAPGAVKPAGTPSFTLRSNGLRARTLWVLASVERAVRWAARRAGTSDGWLMGVREEWRRLLGNGHVGRVAGAADVAAGLVLILPALPWRFRRQRPQQLARALAELGWRVLYVDASVRTSIHPPPRLVVADRGVEVLSLRLPGRPDPYRTLLSREQALSLADLLVTGLRRRPDFVLVQLPFWAPLALMLAERLEVPLVYDRMDKHAEFPGAPAVLDEGEALLTSRAQHLVASSAGLCDGAPAGRSWHVIPNGVVLEDFWGRDRAPRTRRRMVAGYVGALGPWFDAEALARAARDLPDWTFRLAGRVEEPEVRALGRLPNVKLIGEIPYVRVPEFLRRLDVGLVPFRDTALTRAVDAVKMYEYLAAGLPVVARDLPGFRRWGPPAVYRYGVGTELAAAIRQASADDSPAQAFGRHDLLHGETWRTRANDLVAVAKTTSEVVLRDS